MSFKQVLKNSIKARLGRLTRASVINDLHVLPLYGDSYWYAGNNLWEPPVLIALKDLCKPGSVVFDVGGNMGGLTSTLSRLVGPKGTVCTFEASPRIIGFLQQNVAKQGHHNVTVYHRAIFSESNKLITIYDGDHLNDSIYAENSPSKKGHPVKTLALDDFCNETGLYPDLIKMDIEGAEFDALQGMPRLIEKTRPHLLLEQQPDDMRCCDYLAPKGYIFIDLNTYKQIRTKQDYPPGVHLRNLLCVHESRVGELPYAWPAQLSENGRLASSDFKPNDKNGYSSITFPLEPGRYVIDMDFSAEGRENDLMTGLRGEGREIFRYHGYAKLLADSYRDWVIDIPRRMGVTIYFEFQHGTSDGSLVVRGAVIRKLNDLKPRLWPALAMD